MHIGQQIGLDSTALWTLYYTLLLKDLGCSSNAARICALYASDDLSFKREFKWVDGSLPQVLRFVLRNTGPAAGLMDRLKTLGRILKDGDEISQELIQTRCTSTDAARQFQFVGLGLFRGEQLQQSGGRCVFATSTDATVSNSCADTTSREFTRDYL
jgi:hypothetical protein